MPQNSQMIKYPGFEYTDECETELFSMPMLMAMATKANINANAIAQHEKA